MIRAPGGSVCFMVFLLRFFRWRSKVVLLPFKLRLFREPICKIVCFEQCVCLESGQRVSQDMILPKYDFAKISFCQSIVFAKIWWCQTFIAHFLGQMPALIDISKLLVSLRISGSSFVGSTKSVLKDDGSTGTITPCKWAKRQLESVDLEKDTKNSRKS